MAGINKFIRSKKVAIPTIALPIAPTIIGKNLSIKPEDVKESKQEKVDVPVNNNIFDDLTKDEKEGLWIWLNKEDLPQA